MRKGKGQLDLHQPLFIPVQADRQTCMARSRATLPLPNLSDYYVHHVLNVMHFDSGTRLGKNYVQYKGPSQQDCSTVANMDRYGNSSFTSAFILHFNAIVVKCDFIMKTMM